MPSHERDHRRSHDRDARRRTRSRSRSPRPSHDRRHKHRSRSPRRHHSHRHHESSRSKHKSATPASLPFNARQISKRDYDAFKPMFSLYLDIQKQLILEDMDDTEARGRWKSFVGKWNRGELAEGWYDPATLQKAADSFGEGEDSAAAPRSPAQQRKSSPDYNAGADARGTKPRRNRAEDDDDSEDEFAPALPSEIGFVDARRSGPAIPRIEDLALRREHEEEDALASRDDLRYARRADRALQKERLEEIAPRADPGSRERQLEKKREKTSALNEFRNAKEAGDAEVGENELMGDDGVEGFKARRKEEERRKNEREIRKEEVLRARAAEREERLAVHRAKEEQTVDMLKDLARKRWGEGF
ncbi:uncharacterized protein K452DRAFT_303778 [Aplosporella prunicola CBS 121167]|uniref:Uncharacterized protein n=1 Tax=Aplosporella prunicola CBS 121167 TaxID=1176127 RepID=A0A6A6AV81_9PEZI|nr:uncharacterized protein K452DRAFT_303778 [Aplosporella prunicola CBS 121167]KAF2135123.1 hypothetical protein K452DRAFT_303778 [Aplosporella prunicola CBS 121167]